MNKPRHQNGSKFRMTELMPLCGVYKITCTKNGRVYIGQSTNIYNRLYNHTYDLSTGKHCNGWMLMDFQLYGFDAFEIEILILCDKDKLLIEEATRIHEHVNQGIEVYNISYMGRTGFFRKKRKSGDPR